MKKESGRIVRLCCSCRVLVCSPVPYPCPAQAICCGLVSLTWWTLVHYNNDELMQNGTNASALGLWGGGPASLTFQSRCHVLKCLEKKKNMTNIMQNEYPALQNQRFVRIYLKIVNLNFVQAASYLPPSVTLVPGESDVLMSSSSHYRHRTWHTDTHSDKHSYT